MVVVSRCARAPGSIQEFAQGGAGTAAGTARPRVISFCRQGVGDEPSPLQS